ncbi:MAG: hypothetical protein ABS54_04655 [Hyphomicrobium sp. SCN 65-11]|nr:MAG: hypothetical protein ABS54_04655 [Hyphomicrobium sp. SCN 65-11]
MTMSAAEISATVDYSVDKWHMNRLPLGLWFCVGGLAICLHTESRGVNGAALAVVYVALLGLAFAGWAATSLIERSAYPFYVVLPLTFLIAFLVVCVIALFGAVGSNRSAGRMWWSQLVHPPFRVFGWMLLYLGTGWIVIVLFRHFFPARPVIRLSPAGISFHRSWLPDLFIPWQEIWGVGPLQWPNAQGSPTSYPHAVAIAVTRDFYESHMAPKRSILSPPGSERMFVPNGAHMQMVLTSPELLVAPEDIRGPIEARWKEFRGLSAAVLPPSVGAPVVFGRWSMDGSWWQASMLALPLLVAIAIVMQAAGVWPH